MAYPYYSVQISPRRSCFLLFVILIILLAPAPRVQAQTETYYLHKESSSTSGLFQLKTALPDAAAFTVQSAELRNQPDGDYIIKAFDTQANVPNRAGVIPTNSPVEFKLWMRKTDNFGTMYARVKLVVNTASGASIIDCSEPFGTQGGPNTFLTTGFTARVFTCYTPSEITMTATDRFYLSVGVKVSGVGNNRVKAELRMEQGSESNVVIPVAAARATISNLSPASGPVETPVVITGSNFGATQGASTLTFNGVTATPTTWSDTRIDALVPVTATTGPVVVTRKVSAGYYVRSVVGNGVDYSVTSGSIAGTITAFSTGVGITAGFVEARESSRFVAGARTSGTGAYSFNGLKSGTYEVHVSADGYKTDVRSGVIVTVGSTTSLDVSLYKPGSLSGKITKSDGVTGIVGATVKVYQGQSLVGRSVTNSSGNYTIAELSPGTIKVQASASGFQSQTQSGITVSEQATTTSDFSLNTANHLDTLKFGYDELGRLVKVEDKTGEAARYGYDAAGNLLGITRHGPTQVAILLFTPRKGVEGTQIKIYGTGFSANAAENIVNFNGLAATVISANPSELLVVAPQGVTTGPITVISPAGTAVSAEPFTLDTQAPTIASFTPTIADPAAAVTITGTNFEPVISNNGATIGISNAPLASGTTSDLTVSVPQRGGSGKVTVRTKNGNALSTQDFFYPPRTSYLGCCTAAQIEYAQRIAIGETKTMTINTSNNVGMMIFDAVAGQRLGFVITNSLTTTPQSLSYSIFNPDGSILVDNLSISGQGFGFVDSARTTSLFGAYVPYLRYTGTYTILIDPTNSAIGNVSINVREVPPDMTYTIAPGGPTKTVSIASSGQNAQLAFFGTAGQRISLRVSNSTFPGGLVIYEPNGHTFRTHSISTDNNNPNTRFIDTLTLPSTGTYVIVVDPSTTWTGSVNITLYDVPPDVTGSITPGGSPVTVATTVPGQDARLTFNGTAGQRVSLRALNSSAHEMSASILGPDGTSLGTRGSIGTGLAGFVDVVTLPTTGTYTVWLNANTTAGSMTATLYDVPPDVTGSISINGNPFTVNVSVPGQNGTLTFNGTAGQVMTLRVTSNTLQLSITVRNPNNTILVSGGSSNSSFNLTQKTLPATGVYTISVDPVTTSVGSANISVTSP
jgi:YD repeat-containing protein